MIIKLITVFGGNIICLKLSCCTDYFVSCRVAEISIKVVFDCLMGLFLFVCIINRNIKSGVIIDDSRLLINGVLFSIRELQNMVCGAMYYYAIEPLHDLFKVCTSLQVEAGGKIIQSLVKPLTKVAYESCNETVSFFSKNIGLRACLVNDYMFSLLSKKQIIRAQVGNVTLRGTNFSRLLFICGDTFRREMMTQPIFETRRQNQFHLKKRARDVWSRLALEPSKFLSFKSSFEVDFRYLSNFGVGVNPNGISAGMNDLSVISNNRGSGNTKTMKFYKDKMVELNISRTEVEVAKTPVIQNIKVVEPNSASCCSPVEWKWLGLVVVGVVVGVVFYYYFGGRLNTSNIGRVDLFDNYLKQAVLAEQEGLIKLKRNGLFFQFDDEFVNFVLKVFCVVIFLSFFGVELFVKILLLYGLYSFYLGCDFSTLFGVSDNYEITYIGLSLFATIGLHHQLVDVNNSVPSLSLLKRNDLMFIIENMFFIYLGIVLILYVILFWLIVGTQGIRFFALIVIICLFTFLFYARLGLIIFSPVEFSSLREIPCNNDVVKAISIIIFNSIDFNNKLDWLSSSVVGIFFNKVCSSCISYGKLLFISFITRLEPFLEIIDVFIITSREVLIDNVELVCLLVLLLLYILLIWSAFGKFGFIFLVSFLFASVGSCFMWFMGVSFLFTSTIPGLDNGVTTATVVNERITTIGVNGTIFDMLGFCSLVRTVWFGKKGLRGVEDNTSDIIVFRLIETGSVITIVLWLGYKTIKYLNSNNEVVSNIIRPIPKILSAGIPIFDHFVVSFDIFILLVAASSVVLRVIVLMFWIKNNLDIFVYFFYLVSSFMLKFVSSIMFLCKKVRQKRRIQNFGVLFPKIAIFLIKVGVGIISVLVVIQNNVYGNIFFSDSLIQLQSLGVSNLLAFLRFRHHKVKSSKPIFTKLYEVCIKWGLKIVYFFREVVLVFIVIILVTEMFCLLFDTIMDLFSFKTAYCSDGVKVSLKVSLKVTLKVSMSILKSHGFQLDRVLKPY